MVRPRYASTVALVRPADAGGFEVLLTRRPEEMRFLGGFYVFPGGTVHQSDYSPEVLRGASVLPAQKPNEFLAAVTIPTMPSVIGSLSSASSSKKSACCFASTLPALVISLSDLAIQNKFDAHRRSAIVRQEIEFGAFLAAENLFCDLSQVVYFDHWVTPEIYSMRFDTRFYIAASPPAQTPLSHSEEVTHSLWIRPDEAMARIHRRDFPILPPTTTVLLQVWRDWRHGSGCAANSNYLSYR